jgi:leader peptidase (prepilin peptidase) / N-methyltransferase
VGTECIGLCIGAAAALLLPPAQALAAAMFGWFLLPLAILDFRHLWLPNRLLGLLLIGGIIFAPLGDSRIAWTDRAIGGIAGYATLEMVRQLYRLVRRKEGMGGGDPKLLGVLGVWLGWQLLPMTVLIASLLGLAVALLSGQRKEQESIEYPLGTFLALAAYIAVFLP